MPRRIKRLTRQIVWSYRAIYRPYGYGRWRSLRCAVMLNIAPIIVRRWKLALDGQQDGAK